MANCVQQKIETTRYGIEEKNQKNLKKTEKNIEKRVDKGEIVWYDMQAL